MVSPSSTSEPRVVLVVLDGFGERESTEFNAVRLAKTPTLAGLEAARMPHGVLAAAGEAVGLPAGQQGNSEVGHMTLGAGRVVAQDLPRISRAIADGSFFENRVLEETATAVSAARGRVHIVGLTSSGGVHAHVEHGLAVAKLLVRRGVPGARIFWHAILDGRDTPPRSAAEVLGGLEKRLVPLGARLASVVGRFYAMDRDCRWERTQAAVRMLVLGEGARVRDLTAAVAWGYSHGETDEVVPPTVRITEFGTPLATIEDGDAVVLFNYRADRARQLAAALVRPRFGEFDRGPLRRLSRFVTLGEIDPSLGVPVAFPRVRPQITLGEVVARQGWRQLRVAETEKYAHVTYFFNGGVEGPLPGEERRLVPSVRSVATYDKAPAMSAPAVADEVVAALADVAGPRFVLVNFANPDMVGHTGRLGPTIAAVEAVDAELGRILAAAKAAGAVVVVTGDHGKCELLWDDARDEPHTAHTTSPVPIWIVAPELAGVELRAGGGLADVAPTICALLHLPAPREWDGRSLLP